jgi:ABC-type branched-subunit amino acid transport system ATPase component
MWSTEGTSVCLLQLEYFATIKGQCVHLGKDGLEKIQQPRPSVEQMTEDLIADLQLVDDADKQIEALTHSAKRKVSLAIALIGDPQV